MLSRAAARTSSQLISRRGFSTTTARMSSPYHYPVGPYSNLPFNPRSKWFPVGYWTFMIAGFFTPFGLAGASRNRLSVLFFLALLSLLTKAAGRQFSLPNLQGVMAQCITQRVSFGFRHG